MAIVQTKKTEKPVAAATVTPQELKVRSRFIKTPPDKLRLVSRIALGKEVSEAITALSFLPQTARHPLILVLKASISQANDKNINVPLYVKAIAVDEGPKLKRRRIVHQGRATNILKRMSHITIYLTVNKPVKHGRKGSK
jgi:large subunit ribosomal protein L22